MEQENKNRTTYICGICNTKPEQLSHHKAHLNSNTHAEQKIICEYYIRRFVMEFSFLVNNEYRDIYLREEYLADKVKFTEYFLFPAFEDWIVQKSYSIEKKYNLKNIPNENSWINKYNEETHKCCNYEDKIDKILFLDWKIKYLIKEAETIQQTVKKSRRILNCEIIHKINNNEIDETFLLNKFINEFSKNKNENKVYDAYCEFNILKEKQQSIEKNENENENENESQLDLNGNKITILKNENIICETQHELNGNETTIIKERKKCDTNDINLSYIVYLKFKDTIACQPIIVETIILGETEILTKEMWFFKEETEMPQNKTREICKNIKKYIIDLLQNCSSLEKKTKHNFLKNFKITSIMPYLKPLFSLPPIHSQQYYLNTEK